ncbi:flagellin N-terminal helical domain-containing protein [Paenibacillus sp. URB8-2]|uniref:flagellin N-terminal helical domain-containing protein n=1 Tax=Paenibacillus sp. URB8-2 TaxID=2741301 RepID=UPI0015BEE7F1|nr:flagellin [Paenibacillus sp. URB8-2]BCG61341.1 B-type flagellin [Paenibacillus sp. URB8-2]
MIINHNIASLNTQRQLNTNTVNQSKNIEKLSSGLRINRAGDDAAGLAISEKMRGQIRGLDQASRNGQDAISMIQTAEGALNETHSILQRVRELAVQSGTDTNTSDDRKKIQAEVDQLATELTRISNTTEFNSQKLLNGGIQNGNLGEVKFQIGANADQNLSLSISSMDAKSLGVARDKATATVTGATDVKSADLDVNLGTAVTSGTAITLSANATAATATTGAIGGITLTTTGQTSELNGVTINYSDGGDLSAVSVAYDAANKTFTISGDFDDTDTLGSFTTGAQTAAALNAALTANGYTAQVGGAGAGTAATGGTTGTLAGGLASNEVKLTLTAGATNESIIVKNDATTASFTDPTKFKGVNLTLDGSISASTAATVTVGTTSATSASFANGAKTADAVTAAGINVSTQTDANSAITVIDKAITTVSAERSKLGAYQNRLEHTINNLNTSSENLTAAESRIRDVDMAKEMSEQTKNSILAQAAQAMLAQANQQPQGVLQLLR